MFQFATDSCLAIKNQKMNIAQFSLIAIGGSILCILILLEAIALPPDESLIKRSPLLEGTEEFKRWSSVKYLTSFYIFNTTNPDQVLKGERPILQEFGPYVYEDEEVKKNFVYSENGTVSYNFTTQPLRFRPDLSTGFEHDELVVLQEDLISILHFVKSSEYRQKKLAAAGKEHPEVNRLFMHISAGELIRGKHSRFLETFWSLFLGPDVESRFSFRQIKFDYPEFYKEEVRIGSGKYLLNIGQNARFQEFSGVDIWRPPCNSSKGSRETIFPPNIHRGTALHVYFPHLLRVLTFKYERKVVVDGIDAYRFTLAGDELQYSSNSCYCDDHSSVNQEHACPVNGTSRIYWHFSPSTAESFPHFLFGPEKLTSSVRGLEPNKEWHQSSIDVEPVSGIVLSTHIRIQTNRILFRHNMTNVTHEFRQVPEIIYPFAWWDQAYELSDEAVKDALRHRDIPLSRHLGAGKWILLVLGVAVLSCGFLMTKMQRNEDYEARDAVLMSESRTYDE